MIEVYALNTSYMEHHMCDNLLPYIDKAKRKRILKFARYEDRLRTLMSDLLTRSIIHKRSIVRNADIFFEQSEYGKPFLKGYPNFHFNISHSGQWVVCACGDSSVGIDIGQVKPTNYLEIAKHSFSNEEYKDLLAKVEDERLASFYEIWTLKESYIKFLGYGLSIPLNSFSIKGYEGTFELVDSKIKRLYFKRYDLDKDYKLAVCSNENRFPRDIEIVGIDYLQQVVDYQFLGVE
jgi:4'-phosphopantetheinyl transferase